MKFVDIFEFVVQLDEVFNTTVSVDWKQEDHILVGMFQIDGNSYRIKLEPGTFLSYNFINVAFEIKDGDSWSTKETLDNKGASKVISAVISGIEKEIHKYECDAIVFLAASSVDKRMRIYNWIARKYTKHFGSIKENVPLDNGKLCSIIFNKELGSRISEFENHLNSLGKQLSV